MYKTSITIMNDQSLFPKRVREVILKAEAKTTMSDLIGYLYSMKKIQSKNVSIAVEIGGKFLSDRANIAHILRFIQPSFQIIKLYLYFNDGNLRKAPQARGGSIYNEQQSSAYLNQFYWKQNYQDSRKDKVIQVDIWTDRRQQGQDEDMQARKALQAQRVKQAEEARKVQERKETQEKQKKNKADEEKKLQAKRILEEKKAEEARKAALQNQSNQKGNAVVNQKNDSRQIQNQRKKGDKKEQKQKDQKKAKEPEKKNQGGGWLCCCC